MILDLPDPVRPQNATLSPALTLKETSFNAIDFPSSYVNDTLVKQMDSSELSYYILFYSINSD